MQLTREAQILAYKQSLALTHTDVLREKVREICLLWAEHHNLSPVSEWVIKHETRVRLMTRKQLKTRLTTFFEQTLEN
jgi:hypothetical protein